jgi:hypothetical protein
VRHRVSGFDPDEIPPVSVAAEDASMREARRRLAERGAAKEAAAKAALERQLHPVDDFDHRLAAARKAVAPSEPIAYRLVPRQGGFAITAITEEDLAVRVSPKTPLKWPKV